MELGTKSGVWDGSPQWGLGAKPWHGFWDGITQKLEHLFVYKKYTT